MPIGWIVAAVVAVVAGGLSYKAAKDAQKAARKAQDEFAGVLVNKDSNIEPIPVIYGERRIAGTRVYVHTEGGTDVPNLYLYMAIVLAEGPVEDIYDIEIDDFPINGGRYGYIEELNSSSPDRRIFRSTQQTHKNWVYIECWRGQDNQAASDILSSAANWGSNHKLSGVAYLAVRLQWDPDVFSGIPNITAKVKGKKVYDPRTSTTAWSDNPALCIRDYLINTRYGKGLSTSALDDTSFEDAADDLDNFTVTPYTGGPSGVKLFKCNAIVNTGDEIFKNLGDMLLGCKGFLPYSNGVYSLYIDQSVASSVMTLDTSTIIGGIAIKSERKEDKFNRVVCKFPNPETKWEPDQAIWPDSGSTEETSFLSADGGEVLVEEIDLPTITNYYAARDFARIFCLRSRNALRCSLQATSEALNLRIGDRVSVTHPTPSWTAKPFQVEEISLNYDGTVNLQLVEYDSTIYAYDPASEEQTYDDTDLPDPFTVAAVTGLSATAGAEGQSDGTVNSYVDISWTSSDDSFVEFYDVEVVGDELSFTSQSFFEKVVSDNSTTYEVRVVGLTSQIDYIAKVTAVNSAGIRSATVQTSFTAVRDTVAPSAPTNGGADGGFKQITVKWNNPNDLDFKHVKIQVSTNNSTWSDLGVADTESFVHFIDAFGATRYYRLASVDFSGNVSSYTSSFSASTDFVDTNSFTTSVNDLYANANVKQVDVVSSLPASGDYTGQVVFLTTDNQLYRWTGSAWTTAVPAVNVTGQLTDSQIAAIAAAKLTGQITETQITDDAITTPKIDAGAVSANEIAAGAVVAGKIATNAVTAGTIEAGAVTANEIAGNTITGNKIVANTITGGLLATAGIITTSAQIDDAVITTAKIGNAQVETLKIASEAVMIPRYNAASGTVTFGSTPVSLVSTSVTLSGVGQNTRLILIGSLNIQGGSGTGTCNVTLYTGAGIANASFGFDFQTSNITIPVIGSYVQADNVTDTPYLAVSKSSGSVTGASFYANLIIMAAKR